MMSPGARLLLIAGVAVALTGALLASGVLDGKEAAPGPRADSRDTFVRTRTSAPLRAAPGEELPAAAQDPGVPPEARRKFPPGSRIPMRVPWTKSGIPVGNGRYLPLLNGVPFAPAISRDPEWGPVPPVVAKIVDDEGVEYWEHADGSTTTTRFLEVEYQGEKRRIVTTDHAAKIPEGHEIPMQDPGKDAGGKGSGGKGTGLGPRIR